MEYFFDDFGNFQNFVKIWTRRPKYYQKGVNEYKKEYGSILKNMIFHIWESEDSKNFDFLRHTYSCFRFFVLVWNFEYLIYILFSEDEDREMIKIA